MSKTSINWIVATCIVAIGVTIYIVNGVVNENQVVILSIQAIGQANQEIRTVQIMTIHIPNQILSSQALIKEINLQMEAPHLMGVLEGVFIVVMLH